MVWLYRRLLVILSRSHSALLRNTNTLTCRAYASAGSYNQDYGSWFFHRPWTIRSDVPQRSQARGEEEMWSKAVLQTRQIRAAFLWLASAAGWKLFLDAWSPVYSFGGAIELLEWARRALDQRWPTICRASLEIHQNRALEKGYWIHGIKERESVVMKGALRKKALVALHWTSMASRRRIGSVWARRERNLVVEFSKTYNKVDEGISWEKGKIKDEGKKWYWEGRAGWDIQSQQRVEQSVRRRT